MRQLRGKAWEGLVLRLGDVVINASGSALFSIAPKTRRERGGSATRSLVVSEPDIAVLQQQLQEMKDKV